MKRILIYTALAATLLTSCEKASTTNSNSSAQKQFKAWISTRYPDATKTPLGAYIISDEPGTGKPVDIADSNLFVRYEFVKKALDGTIQAHTYSDIAKQLLAQKFNPTVYYGPAILNRAGTACVAGLDESLREMKVGGSRTLAIPGWLNTYAKYSTEEEYLNNASGNNMILEFKVVDAFKDINKWEADSIERYIALNGLTATNDTTGFYFISRSEPTSDSEYKEGATFKINYTGMRLDGQIFDTSVRDVAEKAGILSSSRKYEPQTITVGEKYTDYKMGESSSLIGGFSFGLSKLRPGQKASLIFISALGYTSNGTSDGKIPAYCPLRFDIEVVE